MEARDLSILYNCASWRAGGLLFAEHISDLVKGVMYALGVKEGEAMKLAPDPEAAFTCGLMETGCEEFKPTRTAGATAMPKSSCKREQTLSLGLPLPQQRY